jgi:hypothetical protein
LNTVSQPSEIEARRIAPRLLIELPRSIRRERRLLPYLNRLLMRNRNSRAVITCVVRRRLAP